MNGTRVPPSKLLYFPPRNGPAGLWSPSFATASSLYPSSTTGPLSLVKMMQRVVGQVQAIERARAISPTDQSASHDGVAARAHRGLPDEARMRHARHVRIVRREDRERTASPLLRLDERPTALRGEHVRHVLVLPQRALPPVM